MNALVVSFERLPVGFLGCYGNSWVATPNFDRLATESIVFDQHFGENFDPHAANHAWWTGKYQFPRTYAQQAAATNVLSWLETRDVQTQVLDFCTRSETELSEVIAILNSWEAAAAAHKHLLWMRFPGPRFAETAEWSTAVAEYANQVAKADTVLGSVLTHIDAMRAQPPAVIVTADQGEVVLTRCGTVDEESSLHEERVHVPLVIRLPDSNQQGSRRQVLTQSVDIAPTLADWLGVDFTEADFEGVSLLPLIEGGITANRQRAFMGHGHEQAVRDRDFCLIRSDSAQPRLFLKPEDRYEQADASREYPAVIEELESSLDEFLATLGNS